MGKKSTQASQASESTPRKEQPEISSPSHSQQRVEVITDNSSGDSSLMTARISVSIGSSSLTTSLALKESHENELGGSGKRERTMDDKTLTEYFYQCYENLFGDSIKQDIFADEAFSNYL